LRVWGCDWSFLISLIRTVDHNVPSGEKRRGFQPPITIHLTINERTRGFQPPITIHLTMNERTRGSGGPFRPPSPNIIFRERILRVMKFPVAAFSIERSPGFDVL
jgi:hypothetical protein